MNSIWVPSKSVAPFCFFFFSLHLFTLLRRLHTLNNNRPAAAAVVVVAIEDVAVCVFVIILLVKLQLVPLATAFCSTILIILYLSILLCHLLLCFYSFSPPPPLSCSLFTLDTQGARLPGLNHACGWMCKRVVMVPFFTVRCLCCGAAACSADGDERCSSI